jgi:hypothetical protein
MRGTRQAQKEELDSASSIGSETFAQRNNRRCVVEWVRRGRTELRGFAIVARRRLEIEQPVVNPQISSRPSHQK